VRRWLDERLDTSSLERKVLRKSFPVHHSFFLGEITLFAFITLVLTGIFLTLNYEPSTRQVALEGQQVPAAYASVYRIDRLPFGAVLRSVHHWSAHVMIVAAFLHLLRIFLSGAYKRPREINWFVGLGLLGLVIVTAFTGYALPFDAYAVTATKIGYGIGASIPFVGQWIAEVAFGGEFPTAQSVPRLYPIHVLWLPLTLMALIGLHLLIMVKQKHTQPRYAQHVAPGRVLGVPAWPHQGLMSGILFLVYLGIVFALGGAFIAHPIEAFGPPTATTPEVKPDWYFLWLYGLLKVITIPEFKVLGASITPEFIGGVLVPGGLTLVAAALPLLDSQRDKQRYLELPSQHPVRTSVTLGLLAFFLMATLAGYKDELGLSTGFLWALIVGVPILVTLVFIALIRALYRQRDHDLEQSRVSGD
jgi:cytochrome b-561